MDKGYLIYVFPTLVCLSALFCGFTIDPYHSWGGDFALYIQQAEALLTGNTQELLRVNAYAMDHSEVVLGPHLYPPGFPILLLPVVAVWGNNLLAMKAIVAVCFLLFQGVLYLYFREQLGLFSALILLCTFSLNPWLIRYCNFVISDIPFLLFTTLSLFYMRKCWVGDRSMKTFLILGLSMGFACLIRSIGIVLIGTYILIWLLSLYQVSGFPNRKIYPFYSGLQALGISLLMIGISEAFYPSGTRSYLAYLAGISLSQMGENGRYYLSLPYQHLGMASLFIYLIGIPSLLLGIIYSFRQYLPEFLFCILYLGILLVWPFTDGVRFIFPLLPFVVLFSFLGAQFGVGPTPFKKLFSHKQALLGSFVGILLLACIAFTWRGIHSEKKGKVGNLANREVFGFIQEQIPSNERLSFFRPRILRLYTKREGLALLHLTHASQHGINYHVVNLSEETQSRGEFDQRIFANKEFEIWRRSP